MTEEIKTEFKREGDPAFPAEDTENDNSGDSSPEEKETDTDQTPAPEEDKKEEAENKDDGDNLADHPRWKERESDWKKRFNEQEERHTGDISKLREEMEGKIGEVKPKPEIKIPSWFGGDEDQWKSYQQDFNERVKEAKEGAVKEIESKTENEKKSIEEATNYYKEEVATIESDKELNPEGQKIDRNKLLKFVLDNEIVDTKGRWNYKLGFKMMKAMKTSTKDSELEEKKRIAGLSNSERRAEKQPTAFKTSEDFEGPNEKPW